MTASDVAGAVAWMEKRWGVQAAWKRWEELWADFAPYSAGALKQALDDWYKAGEKFAPKPSELLKVTSETARRRVERGEDPPFMSHCDSHIWAHLDDVRMCVRCREER